MFIHIASFIFIIITIAGTTAVNVINKCCDVTQRFDDDLNCVDITNNETENNRGTIWWIPSSHSSIIEDIQSNKTTVKYGIPNCAENSHDDLINEYSDHPDNPDYIDFSLINKNNEIFVEVLKDNMVYNSNNGGRPIFASSGFCVDLMDVGVYVVRLCPCSSDVQCVRKCCGDKQLFNQTENTCQHAEEDTGEVYRMWRPKTVNTNKPFYRLHGKLLSECNETSIISFNMTSLDKNNIESKLLLLKDDWIQNTENGEIFSPDDYCGDYGTNNEEIIYFCLEPDMETEVIQIVYGVFFMISAIAILLTVLLTIFLPDMRKNIHGKMAFCHNIALLAGFISTGVTHLSSNGGLSKGSCIVISFVIQFSMLAAFFWLNVMCIDIAWVFSALRPIRSISLQTTQKKFIYYSVYAWGSASCISIIMFIVEFTPGTSLKPKFGEAMCFFNDWCSQLLFYYGPMAVLLIANITLYVYTTTKIILTKCDSKVLNANDEEAKNKKKKDDLILYTKLFLLMGATWIFEVVSWAVGGRGVYWVFTDIINVLRGVFIFIIFCCKRTVYDQLRGNALIVRLCGKSTAKQRAPQRATSGATKSTIDESKNQVELTEKSSGMDRVRSVSKH